MIDPAEALYDALLRLHLMGTARTLALSRADGAVVRHLIERWPEITRSQLDLESAAGFAAKLAQHLSPIELAAAEALLHRHIADPIDVLPKGATLYQHQLEGVRWLASTPRALLADSPGIGKTLQSIVAARCVLDDKTPRLVLCPASLTRNWRREVKKWEPSASSALLTSREPTSKARWQIASYDTAKIPGQVRRYVTDRTWGLIVMDECHRLSNVSSRRAGLARILESDRTWLLTGTPIRNRPRDLYGLLKILRHPLGSSGGDFLRRFQGEDARTSGALAAAVAGIVLRREKRDCLDLPEKRRQTVPLDLDEERKPLTRQNFFAMRHDLARRKAPLALDYVLDLVDSGEKVLFFSEYTAVLDTMENGLKRRKVGVVRLDGGVTPLRRDQRVEAFQRDPKIRVLVGQLQVVGEGLNLTAAQHVVFNDLSLVPANHAQAEDRAHRIGSAASLSVHYLLATDLDVAGWALLERKIEIAESFERGVSEVAGAITADEMIDKIREIRKNRKASSCGDAETD